MKKSFIMSAEYTDVMSTDFHVHSNIFSTLQLIN